MAYAEVTDLDDHLGDARGQNADLKQRALDASTQVIASWTGQDFALAEEASERRFLAQGNVIETDPFTELVSVTPETGFNVLGESSDPTQYRPYPLNAAIHQQPYHGIEGYFGWGWHSVGAIWGWPSVPAPVVQACLLMAARLYKRRESVSGTLGFDEFAMRIPREDADVVRLLDPYRLVSV